MLGVGATTRFACIAMPIRPPWFAKILRFGLIGVGASTIASAVVNIVAAAQLLEASDEQSLGITRRELYVQYGIVAAIGAVLVYLGARKWK